MSMLHFLSFYFLFATSHQTGWTAVIARCLYKLTEVSPNLKLGVFEVQDLILVPFNQQEDRSQE